MLKSKSKSKGWGRGKERMCSVNRPSSRLNTDGLNTTLAGSAGGDY